MRIYNISKNNKKGTMINIDIMKTLKDLLEKAAKENYAVGAFNFNNMEFLQAITNGAKAKKAPIIIQTSEGAIKYAGMKMIKKMVEAVNYEGLCLHLDHGRNIETIKQCIANGWTSIMYDGSHLPLEENIKNTKKVAELCHKKGISVEAELGTIGGAEENIKNREIIYTDPITAVKFIEKTRVDALAIAIGTSHGAYKFAGTPKLDIGRLKVINELTDVPLVLHGASSVPQKYVQLAEKYGETLGQVQGVPEEQLTRAVKNGINKINTDTDLRIAFISGIRQAMTENPKEIDVRTIISQGSKYVQEIVEQRIELFGSAGKWR